MLNESQELNAQSLTHPVNITQRSRLNVDTFLLGSFFSIGEDHGSCNIHHIKGRKIIIYLSASAWVFEENSSTNTADGRREILSSLHLACPLTGMPCKFETRKWCFCLQFDESVPESHRKWLVEISPTALGLICHSLFFVFIFGKTEKGVLSDQFQDLTAATRCIAMNRKVGIFVCV